MSKLDDLIIDNVKQRLFTSERLIHILESLIARQGDRDGAVQDRRTALKSEVAAKDEKLKRLYRALGDGLVDLDVHLKDRIQTLKTERNIAQASLDRIAVQLNTRATITPVRLEAFARLMRDKLETCDVQARRAYLRSVISLIEIDNDKVRIIGDKAILAAVITGRQPPGTNVRGFVRNWRARRDSNP
jgi:site-specific DNA recombinase